MSMVTPEAWAGVGVSQHKWPPGGQGGHFFRECLNPCHALGAVPDVKQWHPTQKKKKIILKINCPKKHLRLLLLFLNF
jgi:hypothetical protein